MTFVLFFIDAGFYYSKNSVVKISILSNKNVGKKIILLILTICFPVDLYFSIKLVLYVRQYGYYALINLIVSDQIPLSERITGYIFKLAFYTSFFYKFNKKQTFYIFALYFVDLMVHGIRGSRSMFLFPLCFYIFYLAKVKRYFKVSFRYLIVVFIIGLSFYIASSSTRSIFSLENFSLTKVMLEILYGQGTTSLSPLLYIDCFNDIAYSQIYHPAILMDLTSSYGIGEVLDLTRFISTNTKDSLAINFLCEIYSAGIFGILICFFIGWFIKTIMFNIDRNKFLNVFFIISGMSIPWMPRDNLFRVLYPTNIIFIVFSPLFYYFLEFCGKFLFKQKIEKKRCLV